jgi:diaminopimelate epimerase
MRFTKMHGLGNDYVYVDCFTEKLDDPRQLAIAISDRHFGVGSDGLILVMPSTEAADVRMRMFNADGSEAQMCGNGVRCVAKYAHDYGHTAANPMRVQTAAGIKTIELKLGPDGKVVAATVDMGKPILEPEKIPVLIRQARAVDVTIKTANRVFQMTCVSMGNPHAVFFVDDVTSVPLAQLGPEIENHPVFPARVNAHFVQVHSPTEVTIRTWERGSGITLACGTGASAVCVAGVQTHKTARKILAHLPGGDLKLEWRASDEHVMMTGPATEVFTGDWPDKAR